MEVIIRQLQDEAVDEDLAQRAARQTAQLVGARIDRLSVVFVDDDQIRELNRTFRNRDCTTDVIAFEAEPEGEHGELVGEVIISVPTARRQAQEAGWSLGEEIAWLVSHGTLHAAGMDDTTEEELEEMLALQRRVLGALEAEAGS